MKRDFSNESLLNLLLRAARAAAGRLRGRLYAWGGLFAPGSSARLVFGRGARFINSKAIRLDADVHFGVLARLECFGPFEGGDAVRIHIGAGTSFGDYFHAGAVEGIRIGRNVLGASGVLIIDHNHGEPRADLAAASLVDPKQRALVGKGEIVIGDDVWIGEGALILGGSRIGDGAVIAAGARVQGVVAARDIYFGDRRA